MRGSGALGLECALLHVVAVELSVEDPDSALSGLQIGFCLSHTAQLCVDWNEGSEGRLRFLRLRVIRCDVEVGNQSRSWDS